MAEFMFDVKLFVSVRVNAATLEKAQDMVLIAFHCADSNFGNWSDGSPITGEACLDGDPDLIEIDGESV